MIARPIDALLMALEEFKDFRPLRIVVAFWWRGDEAFQIERERRTEIRMSHVAFLKFQQLIANTHARPGYFEEWAGPVGILGTEIYEEQKPPADVFMAMLGNPEMLKKVDPAKMSPWVRDILPELAARQIPEGNQR